MTDPSPPPEPSAEAASDRIGNAVLAAIKRLAVVVDEDGGIITLTEALATRFETETDELVGQPVSTLFDGESFPTPPATELRTLTPADGAVAVEVRSRRLPEPDGTQPLIGLFITPAADDDTDALDTVGDRFRQLFESVNDAILVVDTDDNRITECNARACELLGYSREELLSMAPREIHPHDYEAFTDFVADVTEHGQGWTDDLSCYTGDDEVIPAEISATIVTLDGTEQLLASIRDISTRVEQAELLAVSRRRCRRPRTGSLSTTIER
ncbi:PAS domain-containing protein [Halonotius sp. GCM10025705]|uniref:PAS domain-containing protein n=1 Tax=Halonotius sp. GCM10025705 TaxID=3252678 RepID=UPI00360BFEBF